MENHYDPPYSTLEVARPESGQDAGKEVVTATYPPDRASPAENGKGIEVVPQQQYGYLPPVKEEPPGYSEPLLPPPVQPRILGLKRKTFFIVAAIVAVVIIGAVVGGVVGGITAKHNSNAAQPSPRSSTNETNTPVLAVSRLASTNWTGSEGNEHHYVFWQQQTGDLMFSMWNSQSNSWNVTNIMASLLESSIMQPAKNGTPLAASVRAFPWTQAPWTVSFGLSLFYLSPSNNVEQVSSSDFNGETWTLGPLSVAGTKLQTADDSQLAAWVCLCAEGCDGSEVVVYEDTNKEMVLVNSSDWGNPMVKVPNVVSRSGLAGALLTPDWGESGPAANSPRCYYDASGVLQEMVCDGTSCKYGAVLSQSLPSNPPSLAAMAFPIETDPAAGTLAMMVASQYANGSLGAAYFNNFTWSNDKAPMLLGRGFANFTALTLVPGGTSSSTA